MALPYLTPLTAAQQAVEGITPVQPFAIADRVRFSELDVQNHVNNTAYMEWFERLRVRYAQEWGIGAFDPAGHSPRALIRSGEIHFRREMHRDDDYVVTCGARAFRTSSYSLHQQIWSGGTLRATFDCVMVMMQHDGSGKYTLPEEVRARFVAVDGAKDEG